MCSVVDFIFFFFFFQAEDGIRDYKVTGVQTCALPISKSTNLVGPAIEVRGFRLERARGRIPGLVGDVYGALHDVSRRADHLRPGDGGTDRNSACAPRFEGEVLQVGDGSVAPHVVSVELRALDADGGERQRRVPGVIFPVHYDDRPPPGCALGHPDTRGAAATHAPDAAAPQHAHSQHVFSAPVQGLRWQAIPAVGLRLTPAPQGQLARLADFHAVHERLIRLRDLAELQVHVPRFALSGGLTR